MLLPWETARWVLLVVSVYALFWVLGSGLSLFQHPHLLHDDELVLRSGHLHAIAVPLRLHTDAGVLSFLSTVATFGTAIDVTVAELSIEAFLPADETTAAALRDLPLG